VTREMIEDDMAAVMAAVSASDEGGGS
jgi:hypothetical protein